MRPVVLLWENFGPYHRDRLRAVAASGRRAIGLQFTAGSNTYGWAATDDALDVRTLLPPGLAPSTRWLLPALLRECRRIGDAEYFFCHYDQPAVLLAAAALRLRGRRVWTMADSKFDDYPRRLWREVVKAGCLLPFHGAITASTRSRDYLRFLGLPAHRLVPGYDTIAIARLRAQLPTPPAPDGLPHAQRDWIVVARLVPKKNVALAIDAYAAWLKAAARPRDLHLLGAGPLEPLLRAQTQALGVADRVRFHGFVQTEAVSRRLACSLALLLPSTEEQFGLVVVEAQAAGLPVLATPQVGATDVLVDAGVNGFVLPAHSAASWTAAMLTLSEDEGTWRRYASAARDGAERGDVARFAEGVAALTG